jgi:hypothetical protein
MTTYPIKSDEHYGWITGIASDGRQVLVAGDMILFFDADGTFLGFEDLMREPRWMERAMTKIVVHQAIRVREFSIEGRSVGVQRYPAFQVSDPGFASRWHEDGLFEFRLGDDFWMSQDGTVNSH